MTLRTSPSEFGPSYQGPYSITLKKSFLIDFAPHEKFTNYPYSSRLTIRVIRSYQAAVHAVEELRIAKQDDPSLVVALDFETYRLPDNLFVENPDDVVRITSISYGDKVFVFDHKYCGTFKWWASTFIDACNTYYVFYSGFEGRCIEAANPKYDYTLLDVGIMRKAALGGGHLSLALQIKYDLGIEISKELQMSDWSADDLTQDQYIYAGMDAFFTMKLGRKWERDLTPDQYRGFLIINNSWRAVAESEDAGFLLDVPYHETLVRMWERRQKTALNTLRKYTPPSVIANLQSKKQLSDFIKSVLGKEIIEHWPKTEKTKQLDLTRGTLRVFSYKLTYPFSRWLAALMVYNKANKYLSTYGQKLIDKQQLSADGRIHVRFNIAQAITGRLSSSGDMNAQNLPNAPVVRRSFISRPDTVLGIADYKGIELRVLAEMSGDTRMLADILEGDLHTESAISLFKFDPTSFRLSVTNKDPKALEYRRRAKGFSFQLTYGAGPPALSVVMRCSTGEAEDFIRRWSQRYPHAAEFRHVMMNQLQRTSLLTCQSGRTIYVPKYKQSLPVASNYPIQGSAADVLYSAMEILHRRLTAQGCAVDGRILGNVHDELILELVADESNIAAGKNLLVGSMEAGWLNIFPGTDTRKLVDFAYGNSWAAKS